MGLCESLNNNDSQCLGEIKTSKHAISRHTMINLRKTKMKTQQFWVVEKGWTQLLKDTELVSFQLLCRALLTGSNPQEKAETRIAHGRSSVLNAVTAWEKDNEFGRGSWGTPTCKGWISNCIHEFEESSWWYWFVDALGPKCMGSENSVFYLCCLWIRTVYILY